MIKATADVAYTFERLNGYHWQGHIQTDAIDVHASVKVYRTSLFICQTLRPNKW